MRPSASQDTENQRGQEEDLNGHLVSYAEQENGAVYPELLTEEELIAFLRIPQISDSRNYHNVIEHLKRFRNLPKIRICSKTLYPKKAVLRWIEKETISGK
jgi:hypothetical protein